VNVEQPLDEKLQVSLSFTSGKRTIREKAEMMFPMWATQGWLQPFRFIDLPEERKEYPRDESADVRSANAATHVSRNFQS